MAAPRPVPGLVLTGGGARAAYQVGVLEALSELLPGERNPFPVVTGTSAGAVAAGVMGAKAYDWRQAVADLAQVWRNFRVDQVFLADVPHMLGAGVHWMAALMSAGLLVSPPHSMLDNSPLRELLASHIDWRGVRTGIDGGHLRGVALSATSYGTGQSVAFYDAVPGISDWTRAHHLGLRTSLGLDHLMASTAIPMVFPAVRLGDGWYGDGSMRQLNPLSPAIHLGADRLLIVGVGAFRGAGITQGANGMPAAGQIMGFMLDTLFTDQIQADLEQLQRLNELARLAPEEVRSLHKVQTLMITPSEDPRTIAARHIAAMPAGLRALLRVTGAQNSGGGQLASYLMFEAAFTRDLMQLGYRDAMRMADPLVDFIRGVPRGM